MSRAHRSSTAILPVNDSNSCATLSPPLRRLAILGNAGNAVTLRAMREVEVAAGAPGLTVVAVQIWRVEHIGAGFEALKARADMLRA